VTEPAVAQHGEWPGEPTPHPNGYASRVDEMLDKARSGYRRVSPHEAARVWAGGGLLVDTRPAAQRAEFGEIPGAISIERNVLEWRLDPTSPDHHEQVTGPDQDIVVFCQAGYASSLAVASLRQLGLSRVTDLVGGYEAWLATGLPTTLTGSKRPPLTQGGHEEVVL
jgi:rhodanese-related sulfurtransferase